MVYKILKSSNQWELIIKETSTDIEYSLMDRYKEKCPVCYYPSSLKKEHQCHIGLLNCEDSFSFITGHYYETDFKGNPNNWFGKLLKNISEKPFKHSHNLFKLILIERITKSGWKESNLDFATMVPTSNWQMQTLFSEVSEALQIKWVNPNNLFIKKDCNQYYDKRSDYVNNKYFLKEDIVDNTSLIQNSKNVLLFDDVLHQGFTFGRIIQILRTLSINKFYLVTIARTIPKSFKKSFSFP